MKILFIGNSATYVNDIPKMLEVADRICIMRQGKVIANLIAKETNLQTVLSLMLTGQA